jgi:putative transposase
MSAHPSLQLSTLVNNLKTVSSRLLRSKFKEHLSQYYSKPVLWSRAYCVLSAGGATIDIIRKYIESQKVDDGDGRKVKKNRGQFISP